ncbi:hypothetical protein AAMO2058_000182300 [Amorphochlora amoebiformis]
MKTALTSRIIGCRTKEMRTWRVRVREATRAITKYLSITLSIAIPVYVLAELSLVACILGTDQLRFGSMMLIGDGVIALIAASTALFLLRHFYVLLVENIRRMDVMCNPEQGNRASKMLIANVQSQVRIKNEVFAIICGVFLVGLLGTALQIGRGAISVANTPISASYKKWFEETWKRGGKSSVVREVTHLIAPAVVGIILYYAKVPINACACAWFTVGSPQTLFTANTSQKGNNSTNKSRDPTYFSPRVVGKEAKTRPRSHTSPSRKSQEPSFSFPSRSQSKMPRGAMRYHSKSNYNKWTSKTPRMHTTKESPGTSEPGTPASHPHPDIEIGLLGEKTKSHGVNSRFSRLNIDSEGASGLSRPSSDPEEAMKFSRPNSDQEGAAQFSRPSTDKTEGSTAVNVQEV